MHFFEVLDLIQYHHSTAIADVQIFFYIFGSKQFECTLEVIMLASAKFWKKLLNLLQKN